MAFKLHGYNISTCTRRVAQIAKERNIPYELVSIDLPTGEHKQEAHVAHQPFGQVPYITVRRPSFFPYAPPPFSFWTHDLLPPGCVARRWFRALRVARYRSIPRDPRVRPGVDPHRSQGARKVRASGERRIRAV